MHTPVDSGVEPDAGVRVVSAAVVNPSTAAGRGAVIAGVATTDYPNAALQTFTHQITSATGDTAAGLVFNGTLDYYSYACFDNVSLVKN